MARTFAEWMLAGWWFYPSWKIWVNGKDYIYNIYPIYEMENDIHVWNHQPAILYSNVFQHFGASRLPQSATCASELRNPTIGLRRTLETSIRNLVKINENDGWAFSNQATSASFTATYSHRDLSAETVAVVSRLMLQKNTAGGRAAWHYGGVAYPEWIRKINFRKFQNLKFLPRIRRFLLSQKHPRCMESPAPSSLFSHRSRCLYLLTHISTSIGCINIHKINFCCKLQISLGVLLSIRLRFQTSMFWLNPSIWWGHAQFHKIRPGNETWKPPTKT